MNLMINDVNKHFGPYHAVKNLSLSVEEGEAVGLLGRNGAGKTTTIRMILGLLNQESGSIQWGGNLYHVKKSSLVIYQKKEDFIPR